MKLDVWPVAYDASIVDGLAKNHMPYAMSHRRQAEPR